MEVVWYTDTREQRTLCAECMRALDALDEDTQEAMGIVPAFAPAECDRPVHCSACDAVLDATLTETGIEWLAEALPRATGTTWEEYAEHYRDALEEWSDLLLHPGHVIGLGDLDDALEEALGDCARGPNHEVKAAVAHVLATWRVVATPQCARLLQATGAWTQAQAADADARAERMVWLAACALHGDGLWAAEA